MQASETKFQRPQKLKSPPDPGDFSFLQTPALLWFRQDLRLTDHPGLLSLEQHPCASFVYVDEAYASWFTPGAAQRALIKKQLQHLEATLRSKGHGIGWITSDSPDDTFEQLLVYAKQHGFGTIYTTEHAHPSQWLSELGWIDKAKAHGITLKTFEDRWLLPPKYKPTLSTFHHLYEYAEEKLALANYVPPNWDKVKPHPHVPPPLTLTYAKWEQDLLQFFKTPEHTMQRWQQRQSFYLVEPERLDKTANSDLSSYLAIGAISPREAWYSSIQTAFQRQLMVREFASHWLIQHPQGYLQSMEPELYTIQWNPDAIESWKTAHTDHGLINAGMQELWKTGRMHNRARMIAGHHLTKTLKQPWQVGAEWFWHTLTDADLANNAIGWQWVAGTGLDRTPHRSFNYAKQTQQYDPHGLYRDKHLTTPAKIFTQDCPSLWTFSPDPTHFRHGRS